MPRKEFSAKEQRKRYLRKRQWIHDTMLEEKRQEAHNRLLSSTDLEEKLEILKEYPGYFDELLIEEQIYFLNKEPEKFFRYSDKALQSYLVQKYPEYYLPYLVYGRMEYIEDNYKYPEFLPSPVGKLSPYPSSMSEERFNELTSTPMSYRAAIKDLSVNGYNSIDIDPGYYDGTLETKEMGEETRFETLIDYAQKIGVYTNIQNEFPEMFGNETALTRSKK